MGIKADDCVWETEAIGLQVDMHARSGQRPVRTVVRRWWSTVVVLRALHLVVGRRVVLEDGPLKMVYKREEKPVIICTTLRHLFKYYKYVIFELFQELAEKRWVGWGGVGCCLTSTKTSRLIQSGREPRTATSTFTQLLSSGTFSSSSVLLRDVRDGDPRAATSTFTQLLSSESGARAEYTSLSSTTE